MHLTDLILEKGKDEMFIGLGCYHY